MLISERAKHAETKNLLACLLQILLVSGDNSLLFLGSEG